MSFFSPHTWKGGKLAQALLPECGKCGLYKLCQSPKMPPSGRGKRRVLLVGEAPGEQEDRKGVQFVGKAGQYLRDHLRRIGVKLDDCLLTNAAICRPPKNEIKDLHVDSCRPNLLKAVRELQPSVIVLLGGSAIRSLMPTEREAKVGTASRWVGFTIPSHEHQAWICPTWHPSYLMRSNDKVLDLLYKQHLKRAFALEDEPLQTEPLQALQKRVEVLTRPSEGVAALRALLRAPGPLAFDYETTGLKPDREGHEIVAVSFCNSPDRAVSMLYHPEMWEHLFRLLRSKAHPKIGANLKHEERWTKKFFGKGVFPWLWDTMLAAHVLDNRSGICSLKFQAYVNFGIADYDQPVEYYFQEDERGFNRAKECPPQELCLYNGLDSLFTYMLWQVQTELMGMYPSNTDWRKA